MSLVTAIHGKNVNHPLLNPTKNRNKMIKFTSNNLIGLGLTSENIKRLKQGQPIAIKGTEIGKSHDILIFYGKNESDLLKDAEYIIDKNHENKRKMGKKRIDIC